MNLALVISSLAAGGAERVLTMLANYWAESGWKVSVLTFDSGATPPFFPLHPDISIIPLDILKPSGSILQSFQNNIERVKKIRGAIRACRAHAVVSFIDTANIRTLLATRWLGIPVVVSERSDPAYHVIGRSWDILRQFTYPWANRVVLQTTDVVKMFPSAIAKKSSVIPNPVVPPVFSDENIAPIHRPTIMAVGRLSDEKGYDLLIKAFKIVARNHDEWRLTFVGDGPRRDSLEELARKLDVESKVLFVGRVGNVYDYLRQADIFVQSSRYEGFPNALCEALATGVPAIATDCSGVPTILEGGKSGLIVPIGDHHQLSEALKLLINDRELRSRLAARGVRIVERFGIDIVGQQWNDVILQAVHQSGQKRS